MKPAFGAVPLRWRVFLATSTTVTLLFALAGWGLEQYLISVADDSARAEIQASIRAYEAIWRARTQVLLATTAVMGAMSDVRAAFETQDERTIRDSAQELWSRVSDQAAVFLVLNPHGRLITTLGDNVAGLSASTIPVEAISEKFPAQLSGYVRDKTGLFYVVLTPVYVQGSRGPLLLNILCAGFPIDDRMGRELKTLAPESDFVFLDKERIFASTLDRHLVAGLPAFVQSGLDSTGKRLWRDQFIVFHRDLEGIRGGPMAELGILYSYAHVRTSLMKLRRVVALAWVLTVAAGLLISSYMTRRLLAPVKLLDKAASAVGAGNYHHRVPVQGTDELSRFAQTFNNMCESIERAQAERIRQEQMNTIGRLGTSLVHDLRNPLAAIYGGAEMLVDGNLPADQTRRIAGAIYRASQRVQELLRDLLNISRGERSEPELCRLKDLIEVAAEAIAAPNSNVSVEIAVDPEIEVVVHRTRVERVFTNLFSNAVEAMHNGGRVIITQRLGGDYVDVFVSDTGPGIPAEIRSNLLRPFVTGKRSGLGLGLALSRQTMTDVGGDLSLVNDGNPGARFCVRFPKSGVVARHTIPSPQEIHS
ncbi:MAG: HAMP domain-containing histidine kinase [Acidobacteriaceae bacterium]|nr:HAMP domain-containing histidine kinase [Acidobacteriaceae bacterium]MBV8572630.1 HAMP domain-containing histidine kinase [Acidobacteriaceae bacterium]